MNKKEFQETNTIDFVEHCFNDTKSKENCLENIAVCEMNSQEKVSEDVVCLTNILKYDCNKDNDDVSCHVQQSTKYLFIVLLTLSFFISFKVV